MKTNLLSQILLVFPYAIENFVMKDELALANIKVVSPSFQRLFGKLIDKKILADCIAVYDVTGGVAVTPVSLEMAGNAFHIGHFIVLMRAPFARDKSPFLKQGEANYAIIEHPLGPQIVEARWAITKPGQEDEPDEGYWSVDAGLYVDPRWLFGKNIRVFARKIE